MSNKLIGKLVIHSCQLSIVRPSLVVCPSGFPFVSLSVSPSLSQATYQSDGQSVSHSVNQSVSQSVRQAGRQAVSQSFRQSVIQTVSQAVRQSGSQAVRQSASQSVDHLVGQELSNKLVALYHILRSKIKSNMQHSTRIRVPVEKKERKPYSVCNYDYKRSHNYWRYSGGAR